MVNWLPGTYVVCVDTIHIQLWLAHWCQALHPPAFNLLVSDLWRTENCFFFLHSAFQALNGFDMCKACPFLCLSKTIQGPNPFTYQSEVTNVQAQWLMPRILGIDVSAFSMVHVC